MMIFLLTLVVFMLSVLGLAIGVLLRRAPLAGSCGSLSCLPGIDCGACTARSRGGRTRSTNE